MALVLQFFSERSHDVTWSPDLTLAKLFCPAKSRTSLWWRTVSSSIWHDSRLGAEHIAWNWTQPRLSTSFSAPGRCSVSSRTSLCLLETQWWPLLWTASLKNLGVTMDQNLTWAEQCQRNSAKVQQNDLPIGQTRFLTNTGGTRKANPKSCHPSSHILRPYLGWSVCQPTPTPPKKTQSRTHGHKNTTPSAYHTRTSAAWLEDHWGRCPAQRRHASAPLYTLTSRSNRSQLTARAQGWRQSKVEPFTGQNSETHSTPPRSAGSISIHIRIFR